MSAPAISPAPSPTPAAAATGAGTIAAPIASGTQVHAAVTGFEAMLATLYGPQTLAAGETPVVAGAAPSNTTAAKPDAAAKTGANDGKPKTKAGADGEVATDGATAAATATPDTTLALIAPPVLAIPTVAAPATPATQAANAGASGQQAAAIAAAKPTSVGQTAAGPLAPLTGSPIITNPVAADRPVADAGSAKSGGAQPDAGNAQAATFARAGASAGANTAASTASTSPAEGGTNARAATAPPSVLAAAPLLTPAATAAPAATAPPPQAQPQPQAQAQAQAQPQAPDPAATAVAAALQPPAPTDPRVTAPQGTNTVAAKSTRVDVTKAAAADGAPAAVGTGAASSAKAAQALQPIFGIALPVAGSGEGDAQGPVLAAKSDEAAPVPTQADASGTASTTTPATLVHAAAVAVRGAPETVANLAAQIVKKLDGRSSQFNVQLDPLGLGKVDVRIAIGADGRMSAAMCFDTPQAAAELKSRSGELQQAMEQAGFDLSGGMSFDVASGGGQGGQTQDQHADAGAAFRGRAFQTALETSADAAPVPQLMLRRSQPAGVDIRI